MNVSSGEFITRHSQSLRLFPTRLSRYRIVAVAALLLTLPFVASGYHVGLANLIFINAIAAVGLNVITGFTGQISIGHGAFLGVGAYASAYLVTAVGVPFLPSVVISGLIAAAVGSFFGIPSVRLKGFYLAIATFAAQLILEFVFRSWNGVTGGSNGMSTGTVRILGAELSGDFAFYWILLPIAAVSLLFVRNLARTATGRALMAVRDHDLAAEIMGVSLFRTKVLAFAIGSFLAGVAGALWGHYVGFITPEQFTLELSISLLVMIIVGGLGSVLGSVLGAIFVTLLPEVLTAGAKALVADPASLADSLAFLREGLFGSLIILALVVEPGGLAARWERIKTYWRLYPFAH
jgi:branched-chain amino acid transport system permease protein